MALRVVFLQEEDEQFDSFFISSGDSSLDVADFPVPPTADAVVESDDPCLNVTSCSETFFKPKSATNSAQYLTPLFFLASRPVLFFAPPDASSPTLIFGDNLHFICEFSQISTPCSVSLVRRFTEGREERDFLLCGVSHGELIIISLQFHERCNNLISDVVVERVSLEDNKANNSLSYFFEAPFTVVELKKDFFVASSEKSCHTQWFISRDPYSGRLVVVSSCIEDLCHRHFLSPNLFVDIIHTKTIPRLSLFLKEFAWASQVPNDLSKCNVASKEDDALYGKTVIKVQKLRDCTQWPKERVIDSFVVPIVHKVYSHTIFQVESFNDDGCWVYAFIESRLGLSFQLKSMLLPWSLNVHSHTGEPRVYLCPLPSGFTYSLEHLWLGFNPLPMDLMRVALRAQPFDSASPSSLFLLNLLEDYYGDVFEEDFYNDYHLADPRKARFDYLPSGASIIIDNLSGSIYSFKRSPTTNFSIISVEAFNYFLANYILPNCFSIEKGCVVSSMCLKKQILQNLLESWCHESLEVFFRQCPSLGFIEEDRENLFRSCFESSVTFNIFSLFMANSIIANQRFSRHHNDVIFMSQPALCPSLDSDSFESGYLDEENAGSVGFKPLFFLDGRPVVVDRTYLGPPTLYFGDNLAVICQLTDITEFCVIYAIQRFKQSSDAGNFLLFGMGEYNFFVITLWLDYSKDELVSEVQCEQVLGDGSYDDHIESGEFSVVEHREDCYVLMCKESFPWISYISRDPNMGSLVMASQALDKNVLQRFFLSADLFIDVCRVDSEDTLMSNEEVLVLKEMSWPKTKILNAVNQQPPSSQDDPHGKGKLKETNVQKSTTYEHAFFPLERLKDKLYLRNDEEVIDRLLCPIQDIQDGGWVYAYLELSSLMCLRSLRLPWSLSIHHGGDAESIHIDKMLFTSDAHYSFEQKSFAFCDVHSDLMSVVIRRMTIDRDTFYFYLLLFVPLLETRFCEEMPVSADHYLRDPNSTIIVDQSSGAMFFHDGAFRAPFVEFTSSMYMYILRQHHLATNMHQMTLKHMILSKFIMHSNNLTWNRFFKAWFSLGCPAKDRLEVFRGCFASDALFNIFKKSMKNAEIMAAPGPIGRHPLLQA